MKRSNRFLALLLSLLLILSLVVIGTVSAADSNAQIEYSFAKADPGYAQGTITITPENGSYGTYYLYWADDNAALENYGEIAALNITSTSGKVTMPKYTAIPADATKLIAFNSTTEPAANERTVSDADIVYDIPEEKLLGVDTKDALYTFGAISDPQLANDSYGSGSYPYDEEHLKAALETLAQRDVDFTVSSGDTANDQNGKQTYMAEYRTYQKILADSSYSKPIYEAIGNHDVGTVWDKNGNYYNDNKPFVTATGLDSSADTINAGKPYFEVTEPTTGDHFIFMALEGGFYTNKGTQFSTAQLDWLESLLKKYTGDGKKFFIIEHANVTGWGSGDKLTTPYYYDLALEKSNPDVTRFVKLMETYKDAVIITGHTHLELSAQYNYSDNNGTSAVMIHNSAIGGVRRLVNGSVDRTAVKGLSEGYIVEVYEDFTLFNGTNMYYNETMPQCCYIVPKEAASDTPEISTTTPEESSSEKPSDPADPIVITLKSSGADTDWVLNSTDRVVTLVDNDTNKEYTATLTSNGWELTVPANVQNITFHRVKNGVISHTWLAGNRGNDTNYFITGDSRGHWENEATPEYADVYLPGVFNNWDQKDAFLKTDDANVVTRTIELSAGTYKFKVLEGTTWLGNSGTINNTTTTSSSGGWEMTASAGDCTLVATGGTYTFNFNTSTNKLIILYTATEKSIAATGADNELKIGDADLSGTVNVKDATAIQKHVAGIITLNETALSVADVTGDKNVNVKDATAIQKFVAGMIDKFPAQKDDVTPTEPTTPTEPVVPPSSELNEALNQAQETLTAYYTYSSYDQYMALKDACKKAENADDILTFEAELKDFVAKIGGIVEDPSLSEITIYFENTKNWSTVYAYVWGSAGQPAAWPGTSLTTTNDNIYSIKVDYQLYQNIIFTNGSGAQTVDIPIVAKENIYYYITGGSNNALTYDTYTLVK